MAERRLGGSLANQASLSSLRPLGAASGPASSPRLSASAASAFSNSPLLAFWLFALLPPFEAPPFLAVAEAAPSIGVSDSPSFLPGSPLPLSAAAMALAAALLACGPAICLAVICAAFGTILVPRSKDDFGSSILDFGFAAVLLCPFSERPFLS